MARLDTLKYRTLRAAALLVGQLWLQTSEMKNVPCWRAAQGRGGALRQPRQQARPEVALAATGACRLNSGRP
jgi:hypothetical protein